MSITVEDFLELVIDESEKISIYEVDTESDENVFEGRVSELMDAAFSDDDYEDILSSEIASWDVENGVLCLNI